MGNIADKLKYLGETIQQIKTAVAEKGVEIPEGAPFRSYVALIREMSETSSEDWEEINSALDDIISETDESILVALENTDALGKAYFMKLCKKSILQSISDKGVTIPDVQPMRTIGALIGQISPQSMVTSASGYTLPVGTARVEMVYPITATATGKDTA